MFINRYFIPNLISLSSIFSGFISLIMAGYGNIKFAASLIILGALFDALDGKVARALHATNKMGKEIDSLADLVTFGVAPAYLVYNGSLYNFGIIGIIISAFLPLFAALRLARFNVHPTYRVFEGIPSTFAGLSIAILQGFYFNYFGPYFFIIYTIGISFLMISKIKYPKIPSHLKKIHYLIVIFILLFSIITTRITILFFIFFYILYGFTFTILQVRHSNASMTINESYNEL